MEERKQPVWRALFLTLLVVVLGAVAYKVYQSGFLGSSNKADTAVAESASFIKACESYRKHPDSEGKFPTKLADLLARPWDGKAYLDGGEQRLLDPWQKPYRYAVVETEAGPVPYVWSEWEYQGKLFLVGARLSADGKAQTFGLAE